MKKKQKETPISEKVFEFMKCPQCGAAAIHIHKIKTNGWKCGNCKTKLKMEWQWVVI